MSDDEIRQILPERKREEIRKRNNRAVMIEVANGILGWVCLLAICFMLSGIGG